MVADGEQMRARPVSDADLDRYQQWADEAAPVLRIGSINWVVVVRSLVAEVRRLKAAAEHE